MSNVLTTIAEVELVYRQSVKNSERPIIQTSHEAYLLFNSIWDMDKIDLLEEFAIMLLNRANKVLGIIKISSGGLTGTVADPRLILMAAIKSASCSIILCHNHPSGNINPSRVDEELTQKIKSACSFVDIQVLDHLIITSEKYFSFADEGIL